MGKRLLLWKSLSILLILPLLLTLASPGEAKAWGAVESPAAWFTWTPPVNTHQFILLRAYSRLVKDPAFSGSGFPDQKDILEHEGVKWNGLINSILFGASGPGPDSEGRTMYSEHYFNPKLSENGLGGAPDAVARHHDALVQGILDSDKNASAKGAAYSAHFLADMQVPYHVTGMPRSEVEQRGLLREANILGLYPVYLTEEESGPPELLWNSTTIPSPGWGGPSQISTMTTYPKRNGNFKQAVLAYGGYSSGTNYRDWFDPWYLNGATPIWSVKIVFSSHVCWEKMAHAKYVKTSGDSGYLDIPYASDWKNSLHNIKQSDPREFKKLEAKEFTMATARGTRDKIKSYWNNPNESIDKAIQRVATLWRASISALKPSIEITAPDPKKPGSLQVKGTVKNVAAEEATSVKAKITVTGGDVSGKEIQNIGSISGGATAVSVWNIETSDPDSCKIKLEVIGLYEKTPDLGYAVVEPLSVEVSPKKVKPDEYVRINVKVDPPQKTELLIRDTGALAESSGPHYTGNNGAFSKRFKVKSDAKEGEHKVTVEAPALRLVGSASFRVGEEPEIDLSRFNRCHVAFGYLGAILKREDGSSYTREEGDSFGFGQSVQGKFHGHTFKGSGVTEFSGKKYKTTCEVTLDPSTSKVTGFWMKTKLTIGNTVEDMHVKDRGKSIEQTGFQDDSYGYSVVYSIKGKEACNYAKYDMKIVPLSHARKVTLHDHHCYDSSVISISFREYKP